MPSCSIDPATSDGHLALSESQLSIAPSIELQVPGLTELWAQTLGDPRICIAVLDGPVDLTHPSLVEAALTELKLEEVRESGSSTNSDHGTHVASVIFGSHNGPVKGVAPNCRGLIIPIFRYVADGSLESCSQQRLARAIRAAARYGANVINISAGQFSSSGEASSELKAAIEECGKDVLIVAAAGNDGCDCLHVPGALAPVLAVGAMNSQGEPLPFSNWGQAYRERGVLAPGEQIWGASADGGVKPQTGTSFSTPIVSGIAGLLFSLQQKLGIAPSSSTVRNAILQTTHGCDPQTEKECERVLAGRLSLNSCVSVVTRGTNTMQNATKNPAQAETVVPTNADNALAASTTPAAVEASACCGGCAGSERAFVYAIGELHYDFPSVLRERSIQQNMDPIRAIPKHQPHVRHGLDFLRHLFGFNEIEIAKIHIGDIDEIEAKQSIYRLRIGGQAGSYRLSYNGQITDVIPWNAAATRIHEALHQLPGLSPADIQVVQNGNLQEYAVELARSAIGGELKVSWADGAEPSVLPIGQLKLSVSDGEIREADIGQQIGINGVSVGKGDFMQPSVLNSCNSLIIRHAHGMHDGKQIVYVSTGEIDKTPEFTLHESHYYLPLQCRVTEEHRSNMYDASAVIWKLNRGQMEVYGIVPDGNFSEDAYAELAEFYMNRLGRTRAGLNYFYYEKAGRYLEWEFGWDPCCNDSSCKTGGIYSDCGMPLVQEASERVAIPGVLQGEVQLLTGVRLPAIKPDMRGTAEWSQMRMLDILVDAIRHACGADLTPEQRAIVLPKIRTLLERLDHSVRNPGIEAQHRALNHVATRLFSVLGQVASELITDVQADIGQAAKTYELDDVVVKPSEIGYAGSDCWDVEVSFFNPNNEHEALVIVSQTVDVNDTIPALTDNPRKFRRR